LNTGKTSANSGSFLTGGPVLYGIIGGAVALAFLIGVVLFYYLRKPRQLATFEFERKSGVRRDSGSNISVVLNKYSGKFDIANPLLPDNVEGRDASSIASLPPSELSPRDFTRNSMI
jgi:hypothetical protein